MTVLNNNEQLQSLIESLLDDETKVSFDEYQDGLELSNEVKLLASILLHDKKFKSVAAAFSAATSISQTEHTKKCLLKLGESLFHYEHQGIDDLPESIQNIASRAIIKLGKTLASKAQ